MKPNALFPDPDSIAAFERALQTRALGRPLHFHTRTRSTNDLALAAGRAGAPHGSLYVAETQDAGRGQRGRRWVAPPGRALLFSVLTRPTDVAPSDLGWIPLLAGLACAQAVESVLAKSGAANGGQLTLKWPNDIVIPDVRAPGWRKLGGILCESVLGAPPNAANAAEHSSARNHVVIGIGLNIRQDETELPPPPLAQATSLRVAFGRTFDRRAILKAVLEELEHCLIELASPAYSDSVKAEVQARLREWWTPDRRLLLRTGPGRVAQSYSFAGLDAYGRLRVMDANGCESVLADAEIIGVE